MRSNAVKAALREGRPSIGTWLSLGNVLAEGGGFVGHGFEGVREGLDCGPAAFDFAEDDLEFFDLVVGKSNGAVSSGAGGFYVHFGFCWFVAMDWCSWANRVRHASGDP